MKLNILLENTFSLSGYINIHPNPPPENKDIVPCDIYNISNIVDDNEAEEIIAKNVLEYIPKKKVGEILRHWVSKLAKNGILIIQGTDISILANYMVMKNLNLADVQKVLYGNGQYNKCTALDMDSIIEFMAAHGLKPIEKSIEKFNFIVKGQRV